MRTTDSFTNRVELCRELALRIRTWTVEQSFASHIGHIGSAFSITELMAVLWGDFLRIESPNDPDRDLFVLSKGHATITYYCGLRFRGFLDEGAFRTYCADGSMVAGHPLHSLPGVELSTGSLGQGLSVACGLAFALRAKQSNARVVCLCSDGECNEGQIWEAAMFAAHHRLGNLLMLVDSNGSQCMGKSRDILDIANLAERFQAFGWTSSTVDGHDVEALLHCLDARSVAGPTAIIARTTLGKGVPFMEGNFEWHYRNLDGETFRQAIAAIQIGENRNSN